MYKQQQHKKDRIVIIADENLNCTTVDTIMSRNLCSFFIDIEGYGLKKY